MSDTPEQAPKTSDGVSVSLSKGIQCFFDVGEHTISIWGSAWTGREIVKVNDEVVSDTRNLIRIKSSVNFTIEGRPYRLELKTESILRGHYRISLYRDGQLIDSDEGTYPNANFIGRWGWKSWASFFIGFFVTGFVLGFVSVLITGGGSP